VGFFVRKYIRKVFKVVNGVVDAMMGM
jgi:hypothetical protein